MDWPDGRNTEVIVISRLEESELLKKLAHFVREVHAYKGRELSRLQLTQHLLGELRYNPEPHGKRKGYKHRGAIEPVNLHGDIVDALHRVLQSASETFNTALIDLYVVKQKRITHIFEVKTGSDRTSVYEGVGQLMLHGALPRSAPKRILVLPDNLPTDTQARLAQLKIRVLRYSWQRGIPVFHDVEKIL